MSLFLLIVIGVGWFASYVFDSPAILFGVIIFAVLLNIFAYWNSDTIAIRLTRAKRDYAR